jgi:hypothetical protein
MLSSHLRHAIDLLPWNFLSSNFFWYSRIINSEYMTRPLQSFELNTSSLESSQQFLAVYRVGILASHPTLSPFPGLGTK